MQRVPYGMSPRRYAPSSAPSFALVARFAWRFASRFSAFAFALVFRSNA